MKNLKKLIVVVLFSLGILNYSYSNEDGGVAHICNGQGVECSTTSKKGTVITEKSKNHKPAVEIIWN